MLGAGWGFLTPELWNNTVRPVEGTIECLRNGVSYGITQLPGTLGNTSDTQASATPTIGANSTPALNQFWSGYMSEFVQFNTDKSKNQTAIIQNQMSFYGIV